MGLSGSHFFKTYETKPLRDGIEWNSLDGAWIVSWVRFESRNLAMSNYWGIHFLKDRYPLVMSK